MGRSVVDGPWQSAVERCPPACSPVHWLLLVQCSSADPSETMKAALHAHTPPPARRHMPFARLPRTALCPSFPDRPSFPDCPLVFPAFPGSDEDDEEPEYQDESEDEDEDEDEEEDLDLVSAPCRRLPGTAAAATACRRCTPVCAAVRRWALCCLTALHPLRRPSRRRRSGTGRTRGSCARWRRARRCTRPPRRRAPSAG